MDHVHHSIARVFFQIQISLLKTRLLQNKDFRMDRRKGSADSSLPNGLNEPWEYDERWYWCYCSLEKLGQQFLIQVQKNYCTTFGGRYTMPLEEFQSPTLPLEQFKVRQALQCQLSWTSIVHPDIQGFW